MPNCSTNKYNNMVRAVASKFSLKEGNIDSKNADSNIITVETSKKSSPFQVFQLSNFQIWCRRYSCTFSPSPWRPWMFTLLILTRIFLHALSLAMTTINAFTIRILTRQVSTSLFRILGKLKFEMQISRTLAILFLETEYIVSTLRKGRECRWNHIDIRSIFREKIKIENGWLVMIEIQFSYRRRAHAHCDS